MGDRPEFPAFKPVELEDRAEIRAILEEYRPTTSEWTFTNLFIWREHYRIRWSVLKDWLLVLTSETPGATCAWQPIGPPSRIEPLRELFRWMKEEKNVEVPCVDRADRRLVEEISSEDGFLVLPMRDDFDYVYRTEDLIELSGRRFHSKKNHVNRFRKAYDFAYEPLTTDRVPACLALAEAWCALKRCEEDMNLLGEWSAVRQALHHREDLGFIGSVIVVDGGVKAFSMGDTLNEEIGVVHVEKADPEIPELYAVINQLFAEREFAGVPFVNREQDLGEPGLRRAKSSYHPHHLEEKFRIRPIDGLWK